MEVVVKKEHEEDEDVEKGEGAEQAAADSARSGLREGEETQGLKQTQKVRRLDGQSSRRVYTWHLSTVGGVYLPNKKIQSLRLVKRRPQEEVELKCTECGRTLSSNWFLVRNGVSHVLRPRNGHVADRVQYLPPPGIANVRDYIRDLDYCEHDEKRTDCITCGGQNLCPHGKLKNNCPSCSSSKRK